MDRYERTTQLEPVLAALAPLSLAALLTFRLDEVPRSLLTIGVAASVHLVVLRLVRDRGNTVQARLWNRWGGRPTVARLRWRSAADPAAHAALHRRIRRVTGVTLPTASAERARPQQAEATYERAVARLRELTRDRSRYHRVFTELLGYSAARNLLGLKPLGLCAAAVVALGSGAAAVLTAADVTDCSWPTIVISGSGAVLSAGVWIAVITPAFVEKPALRYAEALISAVVER